EPRGELVPSHPLAARRAVRTVPTDMQIGPVARWEWDSPVERRTRTAEEGRRPKHRQELLHTLQVVGSPRIVRDSIRTPRAGCADCHRFRDAHAHSMERCGKIAAT